MTDLIERLMAHKTLGSAPRHELEWIAAHGELRTYQPGEAAALRSQPVKVMIIVLTGHLAIYVDRGAAGGPRKLMEWRGGEVTGTLPYSRMTNPPGENVVEEPSEVIAVDHDLFGELITHCPTVTATLVHVMIDRARHFTSTDWQDEKMMSLGRLAAGLAHELNNPASAVARSAKLLVGALQQVEEAAQTLGTVQLDDAGRARLDSLRDGSFIPATTGVFSAIERSDREDEIMTWLEDRGADTGPAHALSESGITTDALDDFAESIGPAALDAALQSVAAGYTARSLAADIERASSRIYDLVSAVKRFTYMDRATVSEPASVAQGVTDTVAVLASKAREKSVSVKLDIPDDLPQVRAFGGELNQVWSNLLENALDAVGPSGQIVVNASREGERVVVRFIDNGPGISPELRSRIFDPFFTTKPMGEGTGLGLDISRRIVHRHDGRIEVDSEPGRTEFRVSLPSTGGY
jgi:signal transduction histidine kinase